MKETEVNLALRSVMRVDVETGRWYVQQRRAGGDREFAPRAPALLDVAPQTHPFWLILEMLKREFGRC